jgi:hypothetical protein
MGTMERSANQLQFARLAAAPEQRAGTRSTLPACRSTGMLKRTFLAVIVCAATAAPSLAANLTAQLFPLTGEVRLRNTSAVGVPFIFYSITSPSGALLSANWKSIADNYDASGNGFIDPLFNWNEISNTSTELTEGAFSGPGGTLPAFRSVSLGNIWFPALFPSNDLTFSVLQADMSPVVITEQYTIVGDYDLNGTVNSQDYNVWRASFGSMTSLDADGNLNGVVDAADYVIWRNNSGLSLSGAGSIVQGSGGQSPLHVGGGVPEPTSALLAIGSFLSAFIARVRVRRAGR